MIKLDKDALAAAISACREYTFAALTMDECGDVARKVITIYLTEAGSSEEEKIVDEYHSGRDEIRNLGEVRVAKPIAWLTPFFENDTSGKLVPVIVSAESVEKPHLNWKALYLKQPANPAQVTDERYDSVALEAAREIMTFTRSGEFDDRLKAQIQVRIIEAVTAAIGAGGQAVAEAREHDIKALIKLAGERQLVDGVTLYDRSLLKSLTNVLEETLSQPHPADERVVEAWRPIKTAPKDGTKILYRNRFKEIGFCHWDTGINDDEYPCWWDAEADDEVCPVIWLPVDTLPAFPDAIIKEGR